jgi:hypothetical protein
MLTKLSRLGSEVELDVHTRKPRRLSRRICTLGERRRTGEHG